MRPNPTTGAPTFFVAGGTLRRDAACYIARKADRQLYESLKSGDICYVLTSRQMGKSSLMVRTAARLREEGESVVILDLTGLGQNLSPHQWYNGLLERVGQQLDLEDELEEYWLGTGHVGPMLRWMDALREVVLPHCPNRLIIFVDEIDAVRSLPFSADEFFAGIRELYNRRTHDPNLARLTFCLLGVASPSDLIRDVRTTPFNVGRRTELTDFTAEEAAPFIEGVAEDPALGQKLLNRVLYWTNGHPYLTQRLCLAIADQHAGSTSDVDNCCSELFLSERARQRDDNLLFVRERILRSETDVPTLLTLYSKVWKGKQVRDDEASPLVTVLRLSGIARAERGNLKVRNRIYSHVFDQDWVTSNLPGAEIRRQKLAFVRGLKVAMAIAVPVVIAAFLYAFFNIYRVKTTIPELAMQAPEPPAFWASFTRPSNLITSGSLMINAGEAGTVVYINNRQYGHTDRDGALRVPVLPPGSYQVRVEKAGYQPVSEPAEIQADKETQLLVRLQKQVVLSASMVIQQGVPGARVLVDGNEVGTVRPDGTFSADVRPGDHQVEVAKDGYFSKQVSKNFEAGKKALVDAQLKPDLELQAWNTVAESRDAKALEGFLRKFPNGRFSEQARIRAEDLEWASVRQSNDLMALDSFLKKYPNGKDAGAARSAIAQLQKEAADWASARNAHDPNVVQAFLNNYPNGQYAAQAREELRQLQQTRPTTEQQPSNGDQQQVLEALRRFGDAFEHKDVNELAQIWPSLTKQDQNKVRDSFKQAVAIRMHLQPSKGIHIDGERATVRCLRTSQYTFPGGVEKSENTDVTVQLQKKTGAWVIQSVQ
jgi:hypothetical protein